jgi:ATP-dependent DNA helicase 2 subunit 1
MLQVYKGSTRAFNALLKTLVEKEKIGLALGLFRRNSSPYFYAMVPQVRSQADQKRRH